MPQEAALEKAKRPKKKKNYNPKENVPSEKNLSKMNVGVPVVAQQKQIQLGTTRLQVRSLASFSGLRIQCCRELWCRLQTWLRSRIAVAVA